MWKTSSNEKGKKLGASTNKSSLYPEGLHNTGDFTDPTYPAWSRQGVGIFIDLGYHLYTL
jgi:hypothetical protein